MKGVLKQVGAFKMLPPRPDVCQICATKHDPAQPHNKQSLYYQYFFLADNNRWPTWTDAMAHCDQKIKDQWIVQLTKLNQKLD